MIGNIFKVLISVKAKLFFGFLAMTFIMSLLGGYAFLSIGSARDVVEDTFDRPLMAINFARSAGQVFSELEIEVLTQINESGPRKTFDAARITPLLTQFKEDLVVAKERSISSRAASFFDNVDENLAEWEDLVLSQGDGLSGKAFVKSQELADTIEEQLDIIVELQTNESFRARERSIAQMEKIKRYNMLAVAAALVITLLLSAWIAVTIINPLKAAAVAARKISSGNFNVDIPRGGDDETGVLLKTLSAMQDNIRGRMGLEQDMRALAQNRLADSLENSKDAILLTDVSGVIIVANAKVEHMFPALAAVDLIQQPYANYFDTNGYMLSEHCRFDAQKSEIQFEDGRWARVSSSQTQEGGRLYIWTDITEEKEQAQGLQKAKEEAEAADKAKSVFLAVMSHELRTPLNAVIGFSKILETHHKKAEGNPAHAEMAGLISKSGAQLLNIVKDVLHVAEGSGSKEMSLSMDRVDVVDVVNYCVKTIAGEAETQNVNLQWQAPQDAFYVHGDILRLQQLLLNLLSNGVKFNRDNGTVKVKLSYLDDQSIRLDVVDNGIGIEAADVTRIMEPFVQVDSGHTRKYEGIGLGLTIVNQILSLHGGNIHIWSEIDKGTSVSVILPALTDSQSVPVKISA